MIYVVIATHWLADFVLQSDKMAKGKSSSNRWLTQHILAYTATLVAVLLLLYPLKNVLLYGVINGVAHFCTDYVTSRITKKLWAQQRVHDFFVVIGLDQAIHMATLVATLPILGKL